MGREVRKVSPNWEHPKDGNGNFVPLKNEDMPVLSADETSQLMMYENTSEGTPISPAFEDKEELARWLADNYASAFADMTATFEQWLCMIDDGFACSMVLDTQKGLRSGVEAACDLRKRR